MARYLILFVVLFSSLSIAKESIVLATHNLPPYGSYAADMQVEKIANEQFKGIAVDRVRCAFAKLDVDLTILVVPWARAQRLAESAKVDGFFAGSQNDYRDSYALRSDIIAEQKWQWYWLKSNPQDINDLKDGPRIGAFYGSNMSKWLEDNRYPIFIRPNTTEQLVLMLKKRRIDIFIANNLVANELLTEMGMMEDVDTAVVKNKPLYLYMTKRNLTNKPKLVENFNQQLNVCISEE